MSSFEKRIPPQGHLPSSYEIQICDDGNKVIAVQMLDKANVEYTINCRQNQFYLQMKDMETFKAAKNVLDQTIKGDKEGAHWGTLPKPAQPQEVTPVGTNSEKVGEA